MTKLFQQQAPLAARQFQLLKDTTVHNEDEVGYCETLMAGRSSNGPSTSNPSAVGRERSVRFCASPDDDFSTTDTDGSSDTTGGGGCSLSGKYDPPCIRWGVATDPGGRERMEDFHVAVPNVQEEHKRVSTQKAMSFFGVFDGHGGTTAAQFAKENMLDLLVEQPTFPDSPFAALRSAFMKVDEKFYDLVVSKKELVDSGSTAIAALVHGGQLFVANAGDSRAVLSRRGRHIELSTDHTAEFAEEREKERVELAGGVIVGKYLNNQVAVTRALGNFKPCWGLKECKDGQLIGPLTAVPDIVVHTLTVEDEFMVLACDGLWDVLSSGRVVELARMNLLQHNSPVECAKSLVQEALRSHVTDNLTVIVVCFSEDPPRPKLSTAGGGFVRVLSNKGFDTISLALADADAENRRSNLQRLSGDRVFSAGTSPASTSLAGP